MEERLSIAEAAERLGVSLDTVRRRRVKGELASEKEETPQGFRWVILLPKEEPDEQEEAPEPEPTPAQAIELELLRERVDELKEERDAWREQARRSGEAERELRILLRQAQELALPEKTGLQDAPGATVGASPISGVMREEREAQGLGARLRRWLKGE